MLNNLDALSPHFFRLRHYFLHVIYTFCTLCAGTNVMFLQLVLPLIFMAHF